VPTESTKADIGPSAKVGEPAIEMLIVAAGKGLAGDAEDAEILDAQRRLARTEGVWAGPTGVATLAVLIRLLARRELDPAQTICVVVSETGLKTEAEVPSRAGAAFDYDALRRLVHERLGAK